MPGNAKNPGNPYAPAVDALSQFNLLVILEYIEHRGGPSVIASLSIGKIPGLLAVIYYIDHERSINHRPADVFDFFHVGRTNAQDVLSEDTQALIYVLDDSENSSDAEAPAWETRAAGQESPGGMAALQVMGGSMQFDAAPDSAVSASVQVPAYPDDEQAAELLSSPASSAWSLPAAWLSGGIWNAPNGLFSWFLGSDTNPFSM